MYVECVSNEIKAASDKNPKKKNVIGRVVSGRIMKKYRLLTELKRATHIKRNSVNNHSKELTFKRQSRNLLHRKSVASDIESFL